MFTQYLDVAKYYWKLAITYRAQYYISLLLNPLRFIILLLIWKAVYFNSTSATVGGYSISELITYFLITSFINISTYDEIQQDLEMEIRKGNFLVYLLKPLHYIKLAFMKKVSRRLFATIMEVVPLLLIFVIFFKDYFVVGNFFYLFISIFFAFVISFFLHALIGMLAFWLIKIRSLGWMIDFFIHFAAGAFIPLSLFPQTFIKIMNFLPFQYISYVPANIYLGKFSTNLANGFYNSVFFALSIQLLWCLILLLIVYFCWDKAQKHFSGVGA